MVPGAHGRGRELASVHQIGPATPLLREFLHLNRSVPGWILQTTRSKVNQFRNPHA
jgi:hypothetical protein